MNIDSILYAAFGALESVASPTLVALLVSVAFGAVWIALAPARDRHAVDDRLSSYGPEHIVEEQELARSFAERALWPVFRTVLRLFARLLPARATADTERSLIHAGRPGNLTALDFWGLRLLLASAGAGLLFLMAFRDQPFTSALLRGGIGGLAGFMLPVLWIRMKVSARQKEIAKSMPNALDLLSIGVEAGLGFETAMLRVGEQWDNELTRELRRTVMEIRVGASREEALQHLAARTGVPDLNSFIAVLVQSSRLGVSIAEVLHQQAFTMRDKRRQRAEALARQAAIKMLFPLIFFIFPAMFIVILGPAVPRIVESLGGM